MTAAEAEAITWVLEQQGFIPADDSALDQMAQRVWEAWWQRREDNEEAFGAGQLAPRAFDLCFTQPRPTTRGAWSDEHDVATYSCGAGWVRPQNLVPHEDFPVKRSPVQMAMYASRWTRSEAEADLRDLWWRLDERPGGWAGAVSTNGRHRSFVAAILDIPLMPTAGIERYLTSTGPYRLGNTTGEEVIDRPGMAFGPQTQRPTTWSDASVATVQWLAEQGLCARPDLRGFRRSAREAIELDWVDPLFPWVVAETPEQVRESLDNYEGRFGALDRDTRYANLVSRLRATTA